MYKCTYASKSHDIRDTLSFFWGGWVAGYKYQTVWKVLSLGVGATAEASTAQPGVTLTSVPFTQLTTGEVAPCAYHSAGSGR